MNIRTKNSRILISAYSSFDDFTFNDEVRYAYKTNAGSLLWNHLISTDYYSYLSLSFSDYKVEKDNINDAFAKARTESGITYAGIKYRLNYSGIGSNILEGGINLFGYSIQPGRQKPLDEKSLVSESSIEKERGIEGAVFLNDELSLSRNLTINAGIRLSGYAYLGPKTMLRYEPDMPLDSTAISGMISYGRSNIIQSYFYAEPRISSRIQINSKSSIKISFNRNVQYLNLISSSAAKHKGTSVVEILQNCVIFNDEAHTEITRKDKYKENTILLKHGQPMLFGQNKEHGIALSGTALKVFRKEENQTAGNNAGNNEILLHDAKNPDQSIHNMLVRMTIPEYPVALGVIRAIETSVFEEEYHKLITYAKEKSSVKTVDDLLNSGKVFSL